jgi:hypothetical protein
MWRSPPLAAAALTALALAGAAAADALDPSLRLSGADQRRARAALVTAADLGGGWSGGPRTPTGFKMPRCPAQSPSFHDLTVTGHAEADFSLQSLGWQVGNDVAVFASARDVSAVFKRILQPKLGTCVRYDVFKEIGSDPNAKLGAAKRLAFPHLAPVSVLYRTSIFYTYGKKTYLLYDDTLMFGKGRTTIWLNIVAPSTDRAELASRERELARLALSRVRA